MCIIFTGIDAQGFYSIHKCSVDLQYMFLFLSAYTTKA